jgi:hypothetical protein
MLCHGGALQLPPVLLSNHMSTLCPLERAVISTAKIPLQDAVVTSLMLESMLQITCHSILPVLKEKEALTCPAGVTATWSTFPPQE